MTHTAFMQNMADSHLKPEAHCLRFLAMNDKRNHQVDNQEAFFCTLVKMFSGSYISLEPIKPES